jgi:hypothetical protein
MREKQAKMLAFLNAFPNGARVPPLSRLHERKASKNACIFECFSEWSKSATALAAP